MTNQFPDATKKVPVPSPELVQQWLGKQYGRATVPGEATIHVATKAAQWGYQQAAERFPHIANQELEACCNWPGPLGPKGGNNLRAARRPKPPSLKEQALAELEILREDANAHGLGFDALAIRRALEGIN